MNNIELFRKFGVTIIGNMCTSWSKLTDPKESKPKDIIEFDYRGLRCSLTFKEVHNLQLMTLCIQENPVAIFKRSVGKKIEELSFVNIHLFTNEMLLELSKLVKPAFEIPNHGYDYLPTETPDVLVEGMELKWDFVEDNYVAHTWLENNVVIGKRSIISNKEGAVEMEYVSMMLEYKTEKTFKKGDLEIKYKTEGYIEDYNIPFGINKKEITPKKEPPHTKILHTYNTVLKTLIIESEVMGETSKAVYNNVDKDGKKIEGE